MARAVIVKPGFVDTPMTAHIARKGPLWAKPEQIAQTIVAAGETGGPVGYTPWFWQPIVPIIRHLPTAIFNKLNI